MSERRELARRTADYAHELQVRKGTNVPYSTHPHAVAEIVERYTDNEDAAIAAELHDVLEDVPEDRYSEEQMRADFGESVVRLVTMVSEDKRADDTEEKSWEERKSDYLAHLDALDDTEALIVSAADKIHNIASIVVDHADVGDDLWSRFNAPKERQLWYYRSIADILATKQVPEDLIAEIHDQVERLARIADTAS